MRPSAFIALLGLLISTMSCRGSMRAEINPAIGDDVAADSVVAAVIRTDLEAGRVDGASVLEGPYRNRDFQPLWIESGAFTDEAHELFEQLDASSEHGLFPSFYNLDELRGAAGEASTADDLARLELDLSRAFVDYATDLAEGRSTGLEHARDPYAAQDESFRADTLMTRLDSESVDRLLTGLAPQHETYRLLQSELERYRRIAEDGGWPDLPDAGVLAPGDTSMAVEHIAERLVAGGYLREADVDSVYTEGIAAAVRAFQKANGLERDSLYGPNTRAAMNISADERVRDIRINLERWRRLPYDPDARHVRVNVPAFRLQARSEHGDVERMKIIAGKTVDDRSTPVFTDRMEYVVFGPYWNIPETIAREEIVPKARENDEFMAENRYQIVEEYGADAEVLDPSDDNLDRVEDGELKMRQAPGRGNALGRVKFMFPNQYSVYLHDTPADHLFAAAERDFSHGCIRVERPVDLAKFVFENRSDWTESRIREAMSDNRHEIVSLDDPVDVYIIYMTASVDREGRAVFFRDIYDRDSGLESIFAITS